MPATASCTRCHRLDTTRTTVGRHRAAATAACAAADAGRRIIDPHGLPNRACHLRPKLPAGTAMRHAVRPVSPRYCPRMPLAVCGVMPRHTTPPDGCPKPSRHHMGRVCRTKKSMQSRRPVPSRATVANTCHWWSRRMLRGGRAGTLQLVASAPHGAAPIPLQGPHLSKRMRAFSSSTVRAPATSALLASTTMGMPCSRPWQQCEGDHKALAEGTTGLEHAVRGARHRPTLPEAPRQ